MAEKTHVIETKELSQRSSFEKASDLVAADRRGSIASIEAARLDEIDGRNGQFHRSFSPRQVHVSSTAGLSSHARY